MGLLQSLGRLWNGSGDKNGNSGESRHASRSGAGLRRPVAIDLHTPTLAEDVAAIDRDLSERLGLKPSPLPERESSRHGGRGTPVAVAAGVAAGVGLTAPGATSVSGEILDPISTVAPQEAAAAARDFRSGAAAESGSHGGNVISALLAIPGESRGRMKSKQQILDQLRDNYQEVLRVVRKVDGQLDQQHRRGERMLEIAEHTVHGRLPELREETRKVADAIERLSTGIGRGQDRLEKGVADQVAAIERVQGLLTQLVDADRSLGESLVEFRRTAAGMAVATERLGSALAGMQDRASRRDDQIAEILDRSQRTLVTVLVLSLVSVAAAITMVVLAVA